MSLFFSCLASLFFLPCCLSSSCPSIPASHVPCNKSIEIKPPFILVHNTTDQCEQTISIRCGHSEKLPKVYIFHLASPSFYLENIIYHSYSQNQLIVRDPALEDSLNSSYCANLLFSFLTPSYEVFDYGQFLSFSNSVKNFCISPNRSFQSPILGREYTLNYSATTDKNLPVKCHRKNQNASFEWKFSFNNDSSVVLLSAQYSNSLISDPGCFGHNIDGDSSTNYAPPKGKTSRATDKIIVIGVAAGLFGLIVVPVLFILLWKHKKLKHLSSSSKLLMQRNASDQYFHESKMSELQYTQIFSYEELEEATEQFSESKELGDGGFGTVYKGKLKDGRVVAVKRLYKNSYRRVEQFMNEVEILSQLHHPNLVTLYGCTAPTSHELLLVYEFISQGTVADHLHGPRSGENILIWPIRLSIAVETADALAYLHAVEIIHRDVKTNNILLDDGFHVKVADFGLSRFFPLDVTHVSTVPQGTPGYVDPVYHQCYQLTDKSDVYSFGVILVELISSKPAVDMSRSSDEINLANLALKKIQKDELVELADPAIGFQSDPEVKQMVSLVAELAFRCLQSDRDMRPSMKEVLEVLRVIQKGNYNSDKLEDIIPSKEEAYLLETAAGRSPKTVMSGWMSQSTTPNISN